jgi:ribosomal protein S18 acetylase RimI-like enzyme
MMASADNDPRRSGTIWMMNLDEPRPVITPLVPATFRRVGPEAVPALAAPAGGDLSAELLKRFEGGRRCYSAWVDGQLAAYGWISQDQEYIGELSLRIKLVPGEVYIWDCMTLPAFRHRHLYSALLVYILGELQAEGLCRVWIGADQDNEVSQRGIANAGFHHVADLGISRVLAMRLVWVQGLPGVPDHVISEARRAFLEDRDKVWLRALSSPAAR